MNTFRLVIATPDGNTFDGQAACVAVRGVDGELAVLAGHIPFVTAVKPCECKITLPDETQKVGEVDSGLINVSEDKVTLLSGSFKWK